MAAALEHSVVIPSRDRPGQLQRCLSSLEALTTPRDAFEVIVVDDGSRTPYEQLLTRFRDRLPLRWIRCEGRGPGPARNAGAEAARGRFLALTDDDCVPQPDWLDQLGAVLRSNPGAMAGGRTLNALQENCWSEASQLLVSYICEYYNAEPGEARFLASCNLSVPREAFLEFGGFDPRFPLAGGEDRDFCDRWRAAGRPAFSVPEAVVHHYHALSAAAFLRQHVHYGRGAWRYHRARAARQDRPVEVEPFGFYASLLRYPFRHPDARHPALLSALLIASQAANAAGFFYERCRVPSLA